MTLALYLITDLIALLFMVVADKCCTDDNRLFMQSYKRKKFNILVKLHISQIMFIISMLILFLVIACRYETGTDYKGYAEVYIRVNNNTLTQSDKDWLGIGFRFICIVIGILGKNNYILMFAVIAAITIYYFGKSIYRISPSWSLSLYLLICFCLYYQCFNQSRQMMAIAITTYSYRYIKENNIKKYFFYIIIATLLHTSAIVMLPLYFIRDWKISGKNIAIFTVLTLIVYFQFDKILWLLSFTSYGKIYLNSFRYNSSFQLSPILNLIIRFIFLAVCMIVSKEVIKEKPYTRGLYNAAIICTIIQVLTLKSYLFGRVTTYYFALYILLIPYVIKTMQKKMKDGKGFLNLGVIIFFALYHFIYYFSSTGAVRSGYDVYKSIFVR